MIYKFSNTHLFLKFIIVFSCFIATFSATPAVAQSSSSNLIDSLNHLASLCFERHDYSQSGEYNRQAMNICRKAGDMEGFAKFAYGVGRCYAQAGLYFEALENYLIALNCRKEQDNFKAAFAVYHSIGNAYFYLGDYASELQWSKEAMDLARVKGDALNEAWFAVHCADAYKKLSDSLSASACYDRALKLYRMAGDTASMAMVLNNKSSSFAPASAEKLSALTESARLYEKMTPSAKVLSFLSHVYCNIGIWYNAANQHDSAAIYYNKAMNTVNLSGDKHKKIYMYSHVAEYYFKRNNTAKAKQLSLETVELIRDVAGDNHTFDIALKILSKIYALENDYRRAYESLLKWSAVNDSVQAKSMREEKDKINSRYTFESHRQEQLAERKRIAERNRNYFIFAAIACILVIVGWVLHSWQMTKKNRGLYRQIKEQDRLAEEIEQLRQRYAATPAVETRLIASLQCPASEQLQTATADEQQIQLFARLREYLLADKHFTNPDIDMSKLITAIGTNRTYLFEAMKTVTGQTPHDYINVMRLEEGKRLLESTNERIDSIAEMSGYKTSRTFYRLFLERYNISPAEYRKMAGEKL
ncbi:MAG: helix-turn-helix domain-containing protein [Dysgonamonadaceae bacterium]|jgi:AraC-like DNA-binding protein|nr:helix-turn-helix domain-containing protein [Dysgonamonadaceae bacterium]